MFIGGFPPSAVDFVPVIASARSFINTEANGSPLCSQRAFKPWDNGDAGAVAEGADNGIILLLIMPPPTVPVAINANFAKLTD